MGSVNLVVLGGYLGQDPEVKSFDNGTELVTLSLATSQTWRDKNDGERRQRTSWHRVVVRHKELGKIAKTYLKKGSHVLVTGQLDQREYEKNGEKRTISEVLIAGFNCSIVLLDKKEGSGRPDVPEADAGDYDGVPY